LLGNIVKKIVGTKNARVLKSLRPNVARIGAMEADLRGKSDEDLRAKTAEFKQRVANGEPWIDSCPRPSPYAVKPAAAP